MAEPPINVEQKMVRKAEEFVGKEASPAGKMRKVEEEASASASAVDNQIFLHFLVRSDTYYRHHWYSANLNETPSLSSVPVKFLSEMPLSAPDEGTSVRVGSSIYYIGGIFDLGKEIFFLNQKCGYKSEVYRLDTEPPLSEWRRVSSMSVGRTCHHAVSVNGKVYVFGGQYSITGPFGEVYDPSSDAWASLPEPPNGINSICKFSLVVHSSSGNNLIIVQDRYGFYAFDLQSWSWIASENLDVCTPAVFMDSTIYFYKIRLDVPNCVYDEALLPNCVYDETLLPNCVYDEALLPNCVYDEALLCAIQLDNMESPSKRSVVDFETKFPAYDSFLLALRNGNLCLVRRGTSSNRDIWNPGPSSELQLLKVLPGTDGSLCAEEVFLGTITIENRIDLLDVL